ncbi:MAG: UDP-3-O-(3-hydroxymyristoyl)glucosamine N-acyltransferase [Saprospiraceae bacterium]|nr:UDP-3-O-(3-hydroxymyristoyl)glucosamine N-acyltransferase [Saprospiraceae bacterium]MBK9220665.1 UDP-3-O-(3-hydroxymyristoyl)glucosamine N-acyltransferase [Saprospiraceae bacterium]
MKLSKPIHVNELASRFGMQLVGNKDQWIYGINEIHKVENGDLTFVDAEKYYSKSINSQASIILINKEAECPEGKTLLITDQPFEVYNQLVLEARPIIPQFTSIAETAYIHSSATIESNVVIGHHAVIGAHAHIQSNSCIGEFTVVGNHVNIQSGVIIGSDAFYYKKTNEGFKKWRSAGRVILHDWVDIGAGCTINKGVSGDTIIGEGTKIDCQVQIGHGVVIGKHCLIASQVGIAGKTILGDHVVLYGQVGIAQNLIIGDRVTVLAKSGVGKNLETGKTYFGIPCEEARLKLKEMAALRILAEKFQKK